VYVTRFGRYKLLLRFHSLTLDFDLLWPSGPSSTIGQWLIQSIYYLETA
jgi:hypothetical protein